MMRYKYSSLYQVHFSQRQAKARGLAMAPGLVGLMLVTACMGIRRNLKCVVLRRLFLAERPILNLSNDGFLAVSVLRFLSYGIAVAIHPENGPTAEWIVFMLLGFVPALLLWLARPNKGTDLSNTGIVVGKEAQQFTPADGAARRR